ncbi:hypothetical protein ES332_D02G156000v1 [Gossypium tomentosum]|uniref:Uncharacterized protein n=1 Tax=Gossypium tomentosum TaxID=34277 RepID=A0A5D2LXL5_GOSTO|nr:hypothetical protein ES332_D02G156000v1 [Gossypium tomentosum]
MNPECDYLFKLLLIGDSGVGKSCLLLRMIHIWILTSIPLVLALFAFGWQNKCDSNLAGGIPAQLANLLAFIH